MYINTGTCQHCRTPYVPLVVIDDAFWLAEHGSKAGYNWKWKLRMVRIALSKRGSYSICNECLRLALTILTAAAMAKTTTQETTP